ncbi:MAG: ABC transporter ATP-binding protein [Rhodobacterales bacterium]|nr:ABC transporter ATP-binding protein [Rhodobacterales bacterium]
MIQVEDLKIHYGEFVAVDNLSFSVKKGSVFGLIGPNGAGKTTTIKAIATLIEPTYGEIKLGDTSVLHEPEEARSMLGYMPDFPPVYDDLRVEEFCDLFAHAYGQSATERKKKVDLALAQTDLTDKRKDLCKSLSRGMKQRALLAKTLVHDPSVMLLDEPGANLDPKARIDMRNLLRKLADQGKTILVSSHVLTELEDLCDEIGIMRNGKMVVCGSLEEITQSKHTQRTLEIELLKSFPELPQWVEQHATLSGLKETNESKTHFQIIHSGSREEVPEILSQMIGLGVEVTSFTTRKSKVEDLFLEIESGSSSFDQDS